MKKLTVLFLLLAMCVAMFAGCGGEKTPAPVDPVDPAPVDPAPVDPVDPAPVDPVDPVDPAPVDPVDPAPADPAVGNVEKTYWTAVSYAEIYEAIGSVTPKTVTVNVDGYKKTALSKEAVAGIKADAGDAGKVTVGGTGSETIVSYDAATSALSISTFVTYQGAALKPADLETGYVCNIEKRNTTEWAQYIENVSNPDKIQSGIVRFQLNKGVVQKLEPAGGEIQAITDFTKDANGKIDSITFGGKVYSVNCNAWGYAQVLEEHLTEETKGKNFKMWTDYQGNILYISVR